MRRVLVGLLLLLGCIAVFSALGFYHWLQTPLVLDKEDRVIVMQSGEGVGHLAYRLKERDLIKNPKLLILYARLTGLENIKQGEYLLPEFISPSGLLDRLVAGDVIQYRLTLVEGWTVKQALAAVQSEPEIVKTLQSQTDIDQFFAGFELPAKNPEGWLFPDTYQFEKGTTDVQLLTRAVTRMKNTLAEEWQSRSLSLPYQSPYEALIMASIVEKETGIASERGQIAGVFVRRLEKGMRLQTDPTVIYGMGDKYNGNIRRRDLQTPTPYNTYVIHGLPPTPIALAGREAIHAALHPEDGTALYFVAKGDGSHSFSATLAEHEAAVKEFQLKRKDNYRSSPAPSSAN